MLSVLPFEIQSRKFVVGQDGFLYSFSYVLPCCWNCSTIVNLGESVEADTGRDITVWNRGVRESSVHLVCTSGCGTCHEASGSKGIRAEITVPVVTRLEVCEGAQDGTCWVGD